MGQPAVTVNIMPNIQIIRDNSGNAQYAVVPYDEYLRLLSAADEDDDSLYRSLPYTPGASDDVEIPHEVVSIKIDNGVSLLAAWRIYRGLSQVEVADKLGISQAAISQLEAVGSRPQKKTREKLALLYNCQPEQMIL